MPVKIEIQGKGINQMKTVVVAGDLVWDNNLVQCPAAPATHHELLDSAILHRRAGGAWYLMDLISMVCSDLETDVKGPNRRTPKKSTSQAYQLWSLHEKKAGSKEKVWRISQFMGCQMTSQEVSGEYLPDYGSGSAIPDVLVLDNLCLGFFRENYKLLETFKIKVSQTFQGTIIRSNDLCKFYILINATMSVRLI